MSDNSSEVSEAFAVIKKAIEDGGQSEVGSYAHTWHCNIAVTCYDAMKYEFCDISHEDAHKVGNDAASRFMKLCFGVDTKA